MNFLINIFFSFIEFLAGLSFADVLFRLPVEKNKRLKHVIISLFLALESAYFTTYWHNALINFMFTLFLWIISLVVFFQISIWFSMLIGIVSGLLGVGLELIGFMIGNLIESINLNKIDDLTRNIVLFSVALVLYLVSVLLSRKKFGFLIPNIYANPPLNKLFFIVSSCMITSLLVTVFVNYLYIGNIGIIHLIGTVLLLICTFLVVTFSYKLNKKLLKDKYNRNGNSTWI
ncbi:hypothetical protein [Paenibacillus hexagrammi]|uniref:Uncharacterized protein n=1 Tax=Paenibacillus hexagrammi TaxID=2908839 RepID=A0ABY3SC95_9BACL|nr:hypothetical protein [Paenibacillus sp. YPD9-1]UJF31604.1 hypothetical protein L0M14_17550 [Paenibacillus sp. YPD9-1]